MEKQESGAVLLYVRIGVHLSRRNAGSELRLAFGCIIDSLTAWSWAKEALQGDAARDARDQARAVDAE
jgi:hypothetical protein